MLEESTAIRIDLKKRSLVPLRFNTFFSSLRPTTPIRKRTWSIAVERIPVACDQIADKDLAPHYEEVGRAHESSGVRWWGMDNQF